MEVAVLTQSGQSTGRTVQLNDAIFGIEPNDHAIYLDVKQYNANQRQGTHKSKDKSEISASTRKIKRQKGTGTARAGSLKSGTRVGGGRIHGPRPRDYSFKLNKKLKKLTGWSVLSTGIQYEEDEQWLSSLAKKTIRITEYIRDKKNLNYTPLPDIFHDAFGHLPFLANKKYGRLSLIHI